MTTIALLLNCPFCSAEHKQELMLPNGWTLVTGEISADQDVLCPKHAAIAPFNETQCPGCVGGWGDCDMWSAFAYNGRRRSITDSDLATIEQGVCPRRTNGTLSIGPEGMEEIDLRSGENAEAEAGKAFADAIREYIREYGP